MRPRREHFLMRPRRFGSTCSWRCALSGTTKSAPQMPTQNPSGDDDYCAICASIFLVSSSFVSEPPELPIPVGFVRIKHSFSVARGVTVPRRFAFRSRAPPAA